MGDFFIYLSLSLWIPPLFCQTKKYNKVENSAPFCGQPVYQQLYATGQKIIWYPPLVFCANI